MCSDLEKRPVVKQKEKIANKLYKMWGKYFGLACLSSILTFFWHASVHFWDWEGRNCTFQAPVKLKFQMWQGSPGLT